MTTYVTDCSADQCVLWGDTPDEAWIIAAAAECDLATFVDDSFPRFMVTGNQGMRCKSLGARRVDWLEPKYQHAALTGDLEGVASVERYRAAWTR